MEETQPVSASQAQVQPTSTIENLSQQPQINTDAPEGKKPRDPRVIAKMRQNLLNQLIKKKHELAIENKLKDLSEKYPALKKGLAHNQFGCALLAANMFQKAQSNLKTSQELVCPLVRFTNVFMNLGNLYAQKKEFKAALGYYSEVVNHSPFAKENQEFEGQFKEVVFSPKLNSFSAYVDAHINLAVMYAHTGEQKRGFQYISKAIELHPQSSAAQINFGDFMRQLGKKDQAIEYTWDAIVKHTRKAEETYSRPQWIQLPPDEKKVEEGDKTINVLVVKWGTRYNADYVNKLYRGIQRNTTWKFKFFCFTDDATDLLEHITVMPLEAGWTGWWGKVTLFKEYPEIVGRKFYIDLDMIVTGNLDSIFSYSGTFGTLKTDELQCEKNHKGGYNSSVMIWQDKSMLSVYEALKQNFQNIKKFIVRFDFWLEMNVKNADFLQDLYPTEISDYLMHCQKEVPGNTRIVCFPRKPKPDDYPSEWIRQKWVL